MKLSNKIFIICLLLCGLSVSGRAQDCINVLKVNTDLDRAGIFINGKYSGAGKAEIKLKKGIYIIKASEPSNVWNARVITDTVNISCCNSTKIIYMSFAYFRYLDTAPQNASVFIEDSLIGYTPLFISSRADHMELRKNGYLEKKLDMKSSLNYRKIDLKFIGVPQSKSFFRTEIFKYLLGGIVVLGGATAYFKLKADNRFSEYQATGLQYKLDETRKYDLISGIAMGALEINFGILIYYFLSD